MPTAWSRRPATMPDGVGSSIGRTWPSRSNTTSRSSPQTYRAAIRRVAIAGWPAAFDTSKVGKQGLDGLPADYAKSTRRRSPPATATPYRLRRRRLEPAGNCARHRHGIAASALEARRRAPGRQRPCPPRHRSLSLIAGCGNQHPHARMRRRLCETSRTEVRVPGASYSRLRNGNEPFDSRCHVGVETTRIRPPSLTMFPAADQVPQNVR
jgi:hypothetical protein